MLTERTRCTRWFERGIILLIGVALLLAVVAAKAAELTCTLPTARNNGEPILAGDLTALTFYADDVALATVPATNCRYTVPSCTARSYHVTAWIGDMESGPSNTVEVVPAPADCRPKPPGGVAVQ